MSDSNRSGMAEERQVPEYTAVSFRDKTSKWCLSVFVINEGNRLISQLDKLSDYSDLVDIVIADGGSSDGSVSEENLMPRGVNTLLVKTGKGRLGSQMRMAFDWAERRGYGGVISMDGNDKDDPSAIPRFIDKLEKGFAHVQGSRFVRQGVSDNLPLARYLGIRFFHAPLMQWASGFRYTDTTNGFRAYSMSFLTDPRVNIFRNAFGGYELHYYLAIRAPRLSFKVVEIPVRRSYPKEGPIPTKITPLRGYSKVVLNLLAACCGLYDPS